MLEIATGVFAVAAIGGLVMALRIFKGQLAPWALSIAHALLGATGLVLLILVIMQTAAGPLVGWALGLLVVAAAGGFFLAWLHGRGRLAPRAVVGVHAGLAVTGFLVLLTVLFG